MEKLELTVNGYHYQVQVEPDETLLDMLREQLKLTGTKSGCNKGECGACTVIMNGMAVNSCLVPALQARHAEILTIEGLSKGEELHPIQEAFLASGAVQCGYCTPGMILSVKALLDNNPKPTVAEIQEGISGNLCRCTGYEQIVQAVQSLAGKKV
ncbi:MAG: (2Fe-2S)-binding protein [Bacillota bacterium]